MQNAMQQAFTWLDDIQLIGWDKTSNIWSMAQVENPTAAEGSGRLP